MHDIEATPRSAVTESQLGPRPHLPIPQHFLAVEYILAEDDLDVSEYIPFRSRPLYDLVACWRLSALRAIRRRRQLAFGMLSVDRLSTDSVWSNLLPELSCRIFRLSSPAPGILAYADDLIFTSYVD